MDALSPMMLTVAPLPSEIEPPPPCMVTSPPPLAATVPSLRTPCVLLSEMLLPPLAVTCTTSDVPGRLLLRNTPPLAAMAVSLSVAVSRASPSSVGSWPTPVGPVRTTSGAVMLVSCWLTS